MTAYDDLPVMVVGAGGHASVLLDALRAARRSVFGLCDIDPDAATARLPDENILGDDSVALSMPADSFLVAVGVGSTRADGARRTLCRKFMARGFRLATIVHPSAVVSPGAEIASGAQIMAGAVIQPGTVIGANAVINTGATVDHDCRIGAHAFIAPGVTLCGGVSVGEEAFIGAGATVLEYRSVGDGSAVGGGALVNRDVEAGTTVCGVPARLLK